MNNIGKVKNKNILLLQGPVGFFFTKLDYQFRKKGANTFRVGLNAGDWLFSAKDNYTPYKNTPEEWEKFIFKYLNTHAIDKIFLFGDCRFYQSILIKNAMKLNIEVFVFEEGYVRPNYITLEKYGVNDYSHLSRDASFYRKQKKITIDEPLDSSPNPVSNWSIVIAYYFIAKLLHFKYPNYKHHRNYSAVQEFFYGTRSLIRKVFYKYIDKKHLKTIKHDISKKYYFVPLQTHNDFQILQHSSYGSIEKFIIEVLESFAKHAKDSNTWLMFKHHPIDRGRRNYTKFIYEQAEILNIEKRILTVHDLHLPTCLRNAIGTITINSTVGLSSLYHEIPTITLGNAIYDIKGLTCKDMSIDDFWENYKKPDALLFEKYRNFLIKNTQINGNFYGLMPQF